MSTERTHSGLLRFITAGSVDDGKSTLIGRLLYDSKSILADQLSSIENTSRKRGLEEVDLSLLTDGLEAEREQGITIDVAYRYFATPNRKFIIGDAPGHEQYTRNMVTAASTADAAVILIDARKGVLAQTRRHTYISQLLRIPTVIAAVNKMDLIDFDQSRFEAIRNDFLALAEKLGFESVHIVPMSALKGDMVVERGESLSWFKGPTLLSLLEAAPTLHDKADKRRGAPLRLPVQRVSRVMLGNGVVPGQDGVDYRGYQGTLSAGQLRVGDTVRVLPSGRTTKITDLRDHDGPVEVAHADQAVVVALADEIDISRGDMLVSDDRPAELRQEITAKLCWLSEDKLTPQRKYWIKHTSRTVRAMFKDIDHRIDINTLTNQDAPVTLEMNDIAEVRLKLQQPVFCDHYRDNHITGSFIVIDDATNNTVAAGVIIG